VARPWAVVLRGVSYAEQWSFVGLLAPQTTTVLPEWCRWSDPASAHGDSLPSMMQFCAREAPQAAHRLAPWTSS
jgi:hypothetical protein